MDLASVISSVRLNAHLFSPSLPGLILLVGAQHWSTDFVLTRLMFRSGTWPDRWRVGYFAPKPRLAMDRVYLSDSIRRSVDRRTYLSPGNILANTTELESETNTTHNR